MLCSGNISKNLCFLLFFGIALFMILLAIDILINTIHLRRAGLSLWFIVPPLLLIAINKKEISNLNKNAIKSISILYALVPCIVILVMTFIYTLLIFIANDGSDIVKKLEFLPLIIVGTIFIYSIGGVTTYILLITRR